MNPSLARQLDEILNLPPPKSELSWESPLLVAARTLSRGAEHEMTATTVVGGLPADDIDAFRSVVRDIADKFRLTAEVKIDAGSFSVRFTRNE